MTRENKTFPPGVYRIQIEVSRNSGEQVVSETLELVLTLDDPCPPNRILLNASPFKSDTFYLGNPEKT